MKKLATKIIALLGLLVFFICIGLGLVAYFTSKKSLVGVLKETMPKVALEASTTIEDGIQNQLNKLNIIASLDSMSISDKNADYSAVLSVMSAELSRSGHKQMALADKNGRTVFNDGKIADLSNNTIFKEALAGKELVTEPALDETGSGIIMIYAVPVRHDGTITGVLMAVRDGLELSDFAGRIKFGETGEAFIINKAGRTIAHSDKALLMDVINTASEGVTVTEKKTSIELVSSATVSSGEWDATSSATVKKDGASDDNGSATISEELGFEGLAEVQKNMTEGKAGFGEYKYNGTSKVSGYAALEKYGWSIAVTVNRAEMLSGLDELRLTFIVISFAFLIIGFVVAYLIGKGISTPVTRLSYEGNIMAGGVFSGAMDTKYTKRKDEIGGLARAFNNINVNVSKIISNVINEANEVGKAIKNIDEHMGSLTSEVNVMSGIIEKLSYKMTENSSSAEEMGATSVEIEGAIDFIAVETQHNAETAGEVSKRAGRLRETAIDSQKGADEILKVVAVKLREAIERSGEVERIQTLSNAILSISNKTNLLALNAAIEASRSGNSGSGFTVVADEIKLLAEKSKQTVNEIKDVTVTIIDSVHILSDSAEQVLRFVEDKVVKDYDMLVETGEQYDNDAQLLNDMVTNLSATTEELYASIQNMAQAIDHVAEASEEGAEETIELAGEVAVIAKKTVEILQKTNDVSKSADRLLELVSVFKV